MKKKLTLAVAGLLCATGVLLSAQGATPDTTSLEVASIEGDNIAVDVRDGLSDEDIAQLGRDYGILNLHDNSPEVKDDANIAVGHSDDPQGTLKKLRQDPRVESADLDIKVVFRDKVVTGHTIANIRCLLEAPAIVTGNARVNNGNRDP